MSEFHVEVVRVGPITKLANADALGLTYVHGYPVILRLGDFVEGDSAVYVPVDAVVPSDDPRWGFLGEHRRIRAKRLRGTFSMGLLAAADPAWPVGKDVAAELRIEKYEPPESSPTMNGENERDPGTMRVYDIEGLRRWPQVVSDMLASGELVVVTEKIHGANGRFVHDGERLWVGSRTCIKREDDANMWWRVAKKYDLATKLATMPKIAVYGEVYGQVQDLKYGVHPSDGYRFAVFDMLDTTTWQWLDWPDVVAHATRLGLEIVPILYEGPWRDDLRALAEGQSTIPVAANVREGIVVKPIKDRVDPTLGRVILKLHGEGYLLRKGG